MIETTGTLLDQQISQFNAATRERAERDSPHLTLVWVDVRAPMAGENPSVMLLTSAIKELHNGVHRVKYPDPPKV